MFFGGLAGLSVWAVERFVARRFFRLEPKPTPVADPQPDKSNSPSDLRKRTAISRSTPEPRNWCPRTMKQLVQMVSGRTGLAKQSTLQPFVGQFLHVNGTSRDVERYEEDLPIHVGVDADSGIYVQCWMRKGHQERYLSQLNIGDPFSAVGKLGDVSERSISLDECELEF